MPLPNSLLQRIKDSTKDRLTRRLLPNTTTDSSEEKVPDTLVNNIKQNIKNKILNLSPVQRELLNPNKVLDPATLRYRIRYSAQAHLVLYLKYNDVWRGVQGYSYRMRGKPVVLGGPPTMLFYGFCMLHNEIHAFKMDKIQGCVVSDQSYTPKWKIEL